MKALRKTAPGRGNVELQDAPIPQIGPDDLLLRVSFCGVCGSDMHIEDGPHPCDPPATLGHEFSGVVAEVGDRVTGLAPGEPVAFERGWNPYPGVGSDGGFAEYMRAPAECMWRPPGGLTQESASQLETVITPMRAVRDEARVQSGDRVVVSGAGAIGLICIALSHQAGARVKALGTLDDEPHRFPLAARLGAEEALVFSDSALAELDQWGPRVWIDASGAAAAINAAASHVAPRGVVVAGGMGTGPWDLDVGRLTQANITLRGLWGGNTSYVREAAQLMASGELDISPLFTSMPLSRCREAFEALRAKQVADAAPLWADKVQQRVLLAVDADLGDLVVVAGGLALDPELVAGGAPEGGDAGRHAVAEGTLVGVGHQDELAGVGVLDSDGDDVGAVAHGAGELVEVQLQLGALFEVVAPRLGITHVRADL